MSEWKKLKDHPLDPEKDKGWYVTMVLYGDEPQLVYYGFRNWKSPWHIPHHWKEPDFYYKIPYCEGIFMPRSLWSLD